VKNVSLIDAISLNVSSMSAGATLGTVGFTMVLLPSITGVNLVYASIIGFLLSVPQIIVYTMMTVRIPRTGGDYVWISRTLGGLFGSSIAFTGFILQTMAFLALIDLAAVSAIGSVGVSLGYESYLPLALPGNVPGADPVSQFILGALIFAALIAINIAKPKVGYKLVTALSITGIIATLVGIFVLIGAGTSGVQSYMNFLDSIGANATYTSIANSYSGSTFDLNGTLFILPFFMAFVYPWAVGGPAVASEIKGKNALRWNILIASVIALLLMTGAFGAMYYVGGFNFTTAALANPTLVYNYSFNFWTLAMGVSNNVALSWFIGIGWILWNISILAYGIIVISRYLFAQAFDRFLPEKLAYISPRYSSPVVAHLIDLIITIFLIAGAAFLYGSLVSLYGAVVAAMIYFVFVGIAAAVYGLKKESGSSKSILAICGTAMALVYVFITYEFVAYPAVWGGNLMAYGYVGFGFIFAIIVYQISKARNSKRGINISLAYKEIPPE